MGEPNLRERCAAIVGKRERLSPTGARARGTANAVVDEVLAALDDPAILRMAMTCPACADGHYGTCPVCDDEMLVVDVAAVKRHIAGE